MKELGTQLLNLVSSHGGDPTTTSKPGRSSAKASANAIGPWSALCSIGGLYSLILPCRDELPTENDAARS